MKDRVRGLGMLALAVLAQSAHAAYAGLWFQCQPRWTAEKNYLLVDVRKGERAWEASWGRADAAAGQAQKDKEGNLVLRGCHALAGKPAPACEPARPPLFATLPKAVADGKGLAVDAALRGGAWLRTDQAGLESLARQCAALRPRANG
ncbi:hypothetical protein GCM10028796_27630 [Ramlibacter monticola]|uniref:DUF2147 domain-containing protein n=1 Tax=Ramlibacter monticola TaxID=1926872 RepID=A0A936Z2H0_9BURK|nr:hypothetical protein [Ramlibacter monticola]MBL0393815.1 hypothetical protein [Ramlibacter monticola]